MLGEINIRQFREWEEYAELEPFDETRADLRSASIVQALRNIFTRKKGQASIPLDQCKLVFSHPEPIAVDPAKARADVLRTLGILVSIHGRKNPDAAGE